MPTRRKRGPCWRAVLARASTRCSRTADGAASLLGRHRRRAIGRHVLEPAVGVGRTWQPEVAQHDADASLLDAGRSEAADATFLRLVAQPERDVAGDLLALARGA